MVEAKFTPEMREILKGMKGKTFKSYEGSPLFQGRPIVFEGNCRINLGREAIVLSNFEKVTQFPGSTEDVTCFQCEKMNKDEAFTPYLNSNHLVYMVNERIKSVAIAVDTVSVDGGDFEIEFDMSLMIRTSHSVYTFTRGWYYDEGIYLYVDQVDRPYDIDEEVEDWKNIDHVAKISRRIEEL